MFSNNSGAYLCTIFLTWKPNTTFYESDDDTAKLILFICFPLQSTIWTWGNLSSKYVEKIMD